MAVDRVEVTSADIARIADVKPTAVSNWRRRHDDFPDPVGGTDRSPRFDLEQVEAWLRRQRKASTIPAEQRLWQAFDSVREVMSPDDALGLVGTLLLHLNRHPETKIPDDKAEFTRLMDLAEHSFTADPRVGGGVADLLSRCPQYDYGTRQLNLLSAATEAATADGPANTFDFLCSRFLEGGPRAGFGATPPELAALMIDLAGPAAGTLLDPACGSGAFLLAAAEHGYQRVQGQDINPSIARLAALRMAFRNSAGRAVSFDVHAEDFLRRSAYPRDRATVVVCHPPFADRNWGYDDLEYDPAFHFGVPPRLEPELAWVQMALAHVTDGGAVVMLMPPGAAFRPSGRRIRAEFVRRGALRAVISLPHGFAAHYALALQVWVLRRPEPATRPDPLLVIDVMGGADQPADTPSGEEIRHLVRGTWSDFAADPAGFTERPGVARAIARADLLDDEVDLSPRRHLPMPRRPGVSASALAAAHERFAEQLEALRDLVPEVADLPNVDPATVRTASLDELAKTGALFLRRPPLARDAAADGAVEETILSGQDIVRGQPPSQTGPVHADPVRNPPIRAGDVLVPVVATRVVARVASEEDAGAYPSSGVYLMRTDPAVLDPWYLAGYLSSSEGGRQAVRLSSSLGGHSRVDPRRARVPMPPLDVQRAYGDAFRRRAEFSRALRTVYDLGQDLFRNGTDAIAADLARADDPANAARAPA